MSINNWWDSDASERYWMEITDRADLGDDLRAPKADASGAESWSYSLVSYVQPGDRVFHWHKSLVGEPALVGWSIAAGPLQTISMEWQAHGTRGRARGVANVGPAWLMPLTGYTPFATPVTRTMINERRAEILRVLAGVQETVDGSIYAPFQHYGRRELRAQQGYLTKFPATLATLLFDEPPSVDPGKDSRTSRRPSPGSGSQGYMTDAAVRAALESHSVGMAMEHYRGAGATQIDVLGKPYDLRVMLDGDERHVEVKGSGGTQLETVQLTQGEVDHATGWPVTDLFVVDEIQTAREADGTVSANGGRVRIWSNWRPAAHALRPTHLRYTLPPDAR